MPSFSSSWASRCGPYVRRAEPTGASPASGTTLDRVAAVTQEIPAKVAADTAYQNAKPVMKGKAL